MALEAHVVWARANRVYVVFGDTSAVARGDTLLFRSGTKHVASARIVDMAGGGLAVARIVSGTLARERKLDRLRVTAARAPLPSPSLLRVGFPSLQRTSLRWGCGPWSLRLPPGVPYRVEPTGRRAGYTLTRDSGAGPPDDSAPASAGSAAGAAWPDTLIVILFNDAADEEIALERGDLDIALFGPGELSSRMRETPRWRERVVVGTNAAPAAGDSTARSACAALGADCAVLAGPELLPYVRALGAEAFLGMMHCGANAGRP